MHAACLVRKDLLPLTVHGHYEDAAVPWLPPTFDMRTQASAFIHEYTQRQANGQHNVWVGKPAQVLTDQSRCVLDSHDFNNAGVTNAGHFLQ